MQRVSLQDRKPLDRAPQRTATSDLTLGDFNLPERFTAGAQEGTERDEVHLAPLLQVHRVEEGVEVRLGNLAHLAGREELPQLVLRNEPVRVGFINVLKLGEQFFGRKLAHG